jgi:hypothetical protein
MALTLKEEGTGGMGCAAAVGDHGARSTGCASAGPPRLWRCHAGDIGGGQVGAGTVQACGMAPPAGGIAGDVDADFHHQVGFHQRDAQRLPAAPPYGERPPRPR